MCNLYSITTNQEAISRLFRVMNRYVGYLAPMPCKQPWPFGYGRDADHAGTSDRHRRGNHTDRHHAQRIEVKGMLVRQCPYCKHDINGEATVCDYCHRDVTGISS